MKTNEFNRIFQLIILYTATILFIISFNFTLFHSLLLTVIISCLEIIIITPLIIDSFRLELHHSKYHSYMQ